MKKVTIEFVDVFDENKSFGDCLNDLLDKYYTTEGAPASSVFLSLFHFPKIDFVPCFIYNR